MSKPWKAYGTHNLGVRLKILGGVVETAIIGEQLVESNISIFFPLINWVLNKYEKVLNRQCEYKFELLGHL